MDTNLKATCISSSILFRFSNYLVVHLLNLYKLLEDNFLKCANSIQVRIYTVWHKRYVQKYPGDFSFYFYYFLHNVENCQ